MSAPTSSQVGTAGQSGRHSTRFLPVTVPVLPNRAQFYRSGHGNRRCGGSPPAAPLIRPGAPTTSQVGTVGQSGPRSARFLPVTVPVLPNRAQFYRSGHGNRRSGAPAPHIRPSAAHFIPSGHGRSKWAPFHPIFAGYCARLAQPCPVLPKWARKPPLRRPRPAHTPDRAHFIPSGHGRSKWAPFHPIFAGYCARLAQPCPVLPEWARKPPLRRLPTPAPPTAPRRRSPAPGVANGAPPRKRGRRGRRAPSTCQRSPTRRERLLLPGRPAVDVLEPHLTVGDKPPGRVGDVRPPELVRASLIDRLRVDSNPPR